MIAWLLATAAFGQAERNQCSTDDAFPLAGTAGFDNALTALRTNAATYSASSFLERTGLRRIALSKDKNVGSAQLAGNFTFGVTRVPVWQEDVTYGECPDEFLLVSRPVDLHAYNFGVAFRAGRVGAFYTASMTAGYMAELAYMRPFQAAGLMVMSPILLGTAPLFGSVQTQVGASAFAQDFVAGVIVDAEVANLRGGYTQSRGWYLSAQDSVVGALFGTIVLRDGLSFVGQARAGLEQLPLPADVEKVAGRPSAFLRVLPLTEHETDPDVPDTGPAQRDLTTGHLEQHDVMSRVDVRFGYAIRPTPQLYNLSLAIHDPTYWKAQAEGGDAPGLHLYVEGGMVEIPAQYYFGVEGGTKLHLRGEVSYGTPSSTPEKAVRGGVSLMMNDPEQTALYPFAVDALTLSTEIKGGF